MTEMVREYWMVLIVAAMMILLIAFGASREAPVARRVFAQFIFNIALPLLVILGTPLMILAVTTQLDERIWAAVIAGAFIATGWLTSTIFAELGKARSKAERMRDYHKALYAEIGNTLQNLWDEGRSDEVGTGLLQRMEADATFVPFVPKEHHDYVFEAILGDIEVLPRQTIDAIVAYYSLIKAISALAEDMRGETFAQLPAKRRVDIYTDFLAMRRQAFAFGQYALGLILAFSEGGAAKAEAFAQSAQPNSRASGQSDPSQGLE